MTESSKLLYNIISNLEKEKQIVAWDDEKKAAVIEAYEGADPTPENSMEIVKDLADEYEESPNGVRMILTKAGVYVKKTPAASSKSSGGSGVINSRTHRCGSRD